jgi:glutamine synthetase
MTSLWSTRDAQALAAELESKGVRAIRVLFPDMHGVARGKDVPIGSFGSAAEEGVAFCAAVLATDLRQTPVVEDSEAFGDLLARPDL